MGRARPAAAKFPRDSRGEGPFMAPPSQRTFRPSPLLFAARPRALPPPISPTAPHACEAVIFTTRIVRAAGGSVADWPARVREKRGGGGGEEGLPVRPPFSTAFHTLCGPILTHPPPPTPRTPPILKPQARDRSPSGRPVRQPDRRQVLGGYLRRARRGPHRHLPRRLRPPARAHQRVLQRGDWRPLWCVKNQKRATKWRH